MIDGDMSNIVHTVAVRIQNGSLTFVDSSVAPKTDLAIRSINAFSGQNATSVAAYSERGEQTGIRATSENLPERHFALQALNVNDAFRNKIPDEVSKLLVPGTHYDRQPHTHHNFDLLRQRITVRSKK